MAARHHAPHLLAMLMLSAAGFFSVASAARDLDAANPLAVAVAAPAAGRNNDNNNPPEPNYYSSYHGGYGAVPAGYGPAGVPGAGGWGAGYGGSGGGVGYAHGGVEAPTVVCQDKGPCYGKKVACPKRCFWSYSRSGSGYGAGGGGGSCTVDCKDKCTATC